jgi:protein-L-isoaspartate(D-aspartate) O-methyltransferase
MRPGDAVRRQLRALALLGAGALLLPVLGSAAPGDPQGQQESFVAQRSEMVRSQIEARGVQDPRVVAAMRSVPRHLFASEHSPERAYEDHPLPIGHGQTISQPYVVAAMTELLKPEPTDRVLEIGTGSGYQAAVLAHLVQHVYSIEIVPELAERAAALLAELGHANVSVITGDGYRGLPAEAPFDGIIVTAAPREIPKPLLEQLAVGGRLVIPVGGLYQQLRVVTRHPDGLRERDVFPVRFVPMTGEAQR